MSESGKQPDPESMLRETGDPYHLDLPDGHGFVSEHSQMPLDKFLDWLEEMRRIFPLTARQRDIREESRCTEEFVL